MLGLPGIDTPTDVVSYYSPFTHYLRADLLRSFTVLAVVVVAFSVVLLAYRRWQDRLISGTLCWVALLVDGVLSAAGSIVALGRPPVWWLIWLRLASLAITYLAATFALREAKQGRWSRAHDL